MNVIAGKSSLSGISHLGISLFKNKVQIIQSVINTKRVEKHLPVEHHIQYIKTKCLIDFEEI